MKLKRKRIADGFLFAATGLGALAGAGALIWILADLVHLGLPHLSPAFLTGDVEASGREGGIAPILLSTLLILICCVVTALPVSFPAAIWLFEKTRAGKKPVGSRIALLLVDLLASIPSIVFGLFGMVFFCRILGLGFSILSGGLTLACMILPLLIRTTVSALESLPPELRRGGLALGLSRTTMIFRILLPVAGPGIAAGFAIATARALSETAALLYTSGYATRPPETLTDSGRALSVHIFDLAFNVPNGAARASTSALVLILLLLIINTLTSVIAKRWTRTLTGT